VIDPRVGAAWQKRIRNFIYRSRETEILPDQREAVLRSFIRCKRVVAVEVNLRLLKNRSMLCITRCIAFLVLFLLHVSP
jgi:hypothetical protein